jgi:L-lactate dehydrogenase complex protein LldG
VGERENILGRIKEALRLPALRPGHQATASEHEVGRTGTGSKRAREWLPAVGPTPEERLALFLKMATDLKAEVAILRTQPELAQALGTLARAEGWKKIALHAGDLTSVAAGAIDLPKCRTDQPYQTSDLENCDAGISECDALIAQTGSVLLTNKSAGGRALSVLPPHHVVLALKEQLIADLPEAFALLKRKYAPAYPGFISFITGPSRTGDIERILVLGAHGPKRLTILLLE